MLLGTEITKKIKSCFLKHLTILFFDMIYVASSIIYDFPSKKIFWEENIQFSSWRFFVRNLPLTQSFYCRVVIILIKTQVNLSLRLKSQKKWVRIRFPASFFSHFQILTNPFSILLQKSELFTTKFRAFRRLGSVCLEIHPFSNVAEANLHFSKCLREVAGRK